MTQAIDFKSYQTTGSITAASNTLTIASNPGFAIGDRIIIEIGGEAGAGARGTEGVGGAWPVLKYASVAAMNADATQSDFEFAWVEASGDVYRYLSGVWTIHTSDAGTDIYYYNQAIPKALCAAITDIVGTTVTLDATAFVSATNANVYYDNARAFNYWGQWAASEDQDHAWPADKTFIMPAGSFAIGCRLCIFGAPNGTIWYGQGMDSTEIFSPDGASCANLIVQNSGNIYLHDFHIRGNAGDSGFGFEWLRAQPQHWWNAESYDIAPTQTPSITSGVEFAVCTGDLGGWSAERIRGTDIWFKVVGAAVSSQYINVKNCEAILTDGHLMYAQWQFAHSDSSDCIFQDCSVDSPRLVGGWEGFRSDGIQIIRPTGRNAIIAMNSSGNFVIENYSVTIEANCRASWFSAAATVIDINSNIQPPNAAMQLGGVITNPVVIFEGYVDTSSARLVGITIGDDNPNVTVTGGYPEHQELGGLIKRPAYAAHALDNSAIRVSGDNCVVEGIRLSETTVNPTWGVVRVLASADGAIIRNCVSDDVRMLGSNGVAVNNMDNARYLKNYAPRIKAGFRTDRR